MDGGLRESEAFHKLCPVEIKRALEEDGEESLLLESQGKSGKIGIWEIGILCIGACPFAKLRTLRPLHE